MATTDKFGGVALETDQFGGIPLDESDNDGLPPISVDPYQKAQLAPRIGYGMGTMGPDDPEFAKALLHDLPSDISNVSRGAIADIAAGVSGNTQFAGNLPAALSRQPLPVDQAIKDAALEGGTGAAMSGRLSQIGAGTLPLLAVNPTGAAGRLALGGFLTQGLADTPRIFSQLGEEMGKNKSDQDPAKLADLKAEAISNVGMTALGSLGLKEAGRNTAITRGDNLRLLNRDLAGEFTPPLETKPNPIRETELQVPPNPFFNPGVREIASRALEEAQNRAIIEPGAEPALAALRREIEPPQIKPVIGAPKAEPLAGQVSFNAPAEAKAVPSARQSATEVPIIKESPKPTPLEEVQAAKTAAQTQIDDFVNMDAGQFDKAIKDSGIGVTSSAYRLGEKLTTEDIPALEAAQKKAHEQRKEASKNAKTPKEFEQSMALGMKGQMFGEAIKWRKAIDEAKANKTTMTEDFAALERKYGVGESDRFGGDLRDAVQKEIAKETPTLKETIAENEKAKSPSFTETNPVKEQLPVIKSEAVLSNKLGETSHETIGTMTDAELNKVFDSKKKTEGENTTPAFSPHTDGVAYGLKNPEALSELEHLRDSASKAMYEAAESGDNAAYKANFGRSTWASGAIEGATKKGPNYDLFKASQKAAESQVKEIQKTVRQEIQSNPLLVGARNVGNDIYLEFDSSTSPISADHIKRAFSGQGRSVEVISYAPNELSSIQGRSKFKVIVSDENGHYSSKAAKNAYREVFETHEPIMGKSSRQLSRKSNPSEKVTGQELDGGGNKIDQEVESVKALDPQSGSELSATDALINKLESLRFGAPKEALLYSLPHPDAIAQIGKTAWNNGIDVAIAAVKAGKALKEAVDEAISYIKKNAKEFDETKIRTNLESLIQQEKDSGVGSGNISENRARVSGGDTKSRNVDRIRAEGNIEGENVRMRNLSARGTKAESIPKEVQEKIGSADKSFYQQQSMKKVVDAVKGLSDADLTAVTQDSPIYTAAKLEQANRLFDAGKNDAGYQIFQDLSQNLTRLGQVINQAKLLNGLNPESIVKVTNQSLKKAGRDPLTAKQSTELSDLSKKRIESERALDKATDEWMKNPTDENAKKAQAQYDATTKADLELQKKSHQYNVTTWPGMLKAFAQGNPLTPISHVANILGNTLGSAMEASSRTVAAQLDMIRSALTGNERQVKVQPIRGPIEAGKGYLQGVREMPGIIAKGRGDIVKGEATKGLQPLRSFVKAFAKNPEGPTVGGKIPFNERVRQAVEGTFGIAPEINLRLLSAADRPAYLSARSRLMAEQLGLSKVPKDKWPMAQKFPELFFDKSTVSRINTEAADAVFQKPSKAINYLQALINEKTGPWGDFAFTMLVSPYKLTPWNLVKRTVQYNPLAAATESIYNASKGNARKAELAAGRMVVGGILYTAGYFLYKNGLVGPSMDRRDESQKARMLSGEVLPPNHVNVSGLKRLIKGEDAGFKPGDETYDLTRGGGAAGAILTSVSNIGREFERKPEDTDNFVLQLAANSALQQASFTVNQSFLKGVTGLLDAVQDRNIAPYINGVENMVLNVPTPNTLSSLSRATRKFAPDLKGGTLLKDFENVARNRFGIAGLDDYLPTKRDLWGEPLRQTPEGRNAILYQLFDISKGKQVTGDPVSLELYSLWRKTGDTAVIPSLPNRSFTHQKTTYELSPDQYSRFSELVGKNRRERVDMMVGNPFWQDLPEEGKVKRLEEAYRRGMDFGKTEFLIETDENQLKEQGKKAGFK